MPPSIVSSIEQFDELLKKNTVVVVKFIDDVTSEGEFERLSEEHRSLAFCVVASNSHPELVERFSVSTFPTVLSISKVAHLNGRRTQGNNDEGVRDLVSSLSNDVLAATKAMQFFLAAASNVASRNSNQVEENQSENSSENNCTWEFSSLDEAFASLRQEQETVLVVALLDDSSESKSGCRRLKKLLREAVASKSSSFVLVCLREGSDAFSLFAADHPCFQFPTIYLLPPSRDSPVLSVLHGVAELDKAALERAREKLRVRSQPDVVAQERASKSIEERKQSMKEKIDAVKEKKRREAEAEERRKEKERVEQGKAAAASRKKAAEIREELERKKAAAERKKEADYAKRLREQIRQDAIERKRKAGKLPSSSETASGSKEKENSNSSSKEKKPTPPPVNRSLLSVRLLTGETIRREFSSDATVSDVFAWIEESDPLASSMVVSYPPVTIEKENDALKSLSSVGIGARATIRAIRESLTNVEQGGESEAQSWLSFLLSIFPFSLFATLFGGGGTPAPPLTTTSEPSRRQSPKASSSSSSSSSTRRPVGTLGELRRRQRPAEEGDPEEHYNGNSTSFF